MSIDPFSPEWTEWPRLSLDGKSPILQAELTVRRNLRPYPFVSVLGEEGKQEIYRILQSEILRKTDFYEVLVDRMDPLDVSLLKERLFPFGREEALHPLFIGERDHFFITLFQGDHLLLHVPGTLKRISYSLDKVSQVVDDLEQVLEVAEEDDFGYLTQSVTDAGLGARISALLYLPSLNMAGNNLDSLRKSLLTRQILMEEEELFPGHSPFLSPALYRLRTISASFRSLTDFFSSFSDMMRQIQTLEEGSLMQQKEEKHPEREDRVFRSLGILRYGRMISQEEAFRALLDLTFGIRMSWIRDIDPDKVALLLSLIGSGHIKKALFLEKAVPEDNNLIKLYRGTFLRDALKC